jgi:2,4-dienoyl-CoA reductase-like NADH-dependent reductase (Old Yellow Enzyme family)
MCQYSADEGQATDWHLSHWTSLLNSGAAMMTIEATGVTSDGRITPHCLGLWDERTEQALGNVLARARKNAPPTPVCLQLSHAGRKGSSAAPWHGGGLLTPAQGGWQTLAPSAVSQLPGETSPAALTMAQIKQLSQAFGVAAQRAKRIGLDALELHAAHGYLMHQFLSPISNQRDDQYGGSLENRMRFPLEVFESVRAEFDGPVGVRVSATDWIEGGWDLEQTQELASRLKALGCDFIHVSSGGISPLQKITLGPGYQVPMAREIKKSSGLPTVAVGLITQAQQAEEILQAGDADLVAIARAILYKPRWPWEAAAALGAQVRASEQYWRCLPREAQSIFGNLKIGMR